MILRNWISGMRPVFAGSKVLQIKQLAMTMKIMMGAMKSYSKTANKVVSSGSARRWQETRRRYSLNEREACLDSDSHHVTLMCNLDLNNFNFPTWCPQTLAQSLPLSAPHLPGGSESIKIYFTLCQIVFLRHSHPSFNIFINETLKPRHLRSFWVSRRFKIPSLS